MPATFHFPREEGESAMINFTRLFIGLSIFILVGCASPTLTPVLTLMPVRNATLTTSPTPTLTPTLTRTFTPAAAPTNTVTPTRTPIPAPKPDIVLIPDQMKMAGNVATRMNTSVACTANWFGNAPSGSIILGAMPTSCELLKGRGGSVSATVFLTAIAPSTVYTLRLNWAVGTGNGLRSAKSNQLAQITFDNNPVWRKRTVGPSLPTGYYAAEQPPFLTTVVVTQSLTHTLTISVPAQTAWNLSAIEFYASPMPALVRGIGYSPYRDCEYPGSPLEATAQEIAEDFRHVPFSANAIRTYASTGPNALVPAVALDTGMTVYAGAWIDRKPKDDAEVQGIIQIANSTAVQGVIVGSEFYLRHNSRDDLQYLLQRIVQVKSHLKNKAIAIATAEIDSFMFDFPSNNAVVPTQIKPEYRPILDQLDVVLVHIYPFWNGLSVENAAEFTVQRYVAIKELLAREYPNQNKRLIIGEAGWPSGVFPNGAALPSFANQERYLIEFLKQADQANVEYFYFDAFDELWKIEEPGQVGQHWGYAYSDRTAKYGFYGVLLRPDLLPLPKAITTKLDVPTPTPAQGKRAPFVVFSEWPEASAHLRISSSGSYSTLPSDGSSVKPSAETPFFIPSGFMGDVDNIRLYACNRELPHSGEMAIRMAYTRGTLGWGGVYWQYPENNWGDMNSGIDLTGATQVSFWARSEQPNAQLDFLVGGIGYATDSAGKTICSHPIASFPDSICPKISKRITLTPTWTKYSIQIPSSTNLKKAIGGFGWVTNRTNVFYLDDIQFEFE